MQVKFSRFQTFMSVEKVNWTELYGRTAKVNIIRFMSVEKLSLQSKCQRFDLRRLRQQPKVFLDLNESHPRANCDVGFDDKFRSFIKNSR